MKLASRPIAVVAILGLAPGLDAGCFHWVPVSPADLAAGREEIRLRRVRFGGEAQPVELIVHRVSYPTVDGWNETSGSEVRLNAEHHPPIEVHRADTWGSFGIALAGLGTLGLLGGLAYVVAAGIGGH